MKTKRVQKTIKLQQSPALTRSCQWHVFCQLTGLKSDSHLPKKIFYLLQCDGPSKMMKNAYFILKALFVLKIFKFLS